MLLNREDRETEMTYGDGIWLIGFVLLPNGEANHAEGEALNKRCRRDTDYEKCVSRSRPQGVMCKARGLFHDLGMRNSGQ